MFTFSVANTDPILLICQAVIGTDAFLMIFLFLQEFTGNTNANDMLKHDLNRPITTHFIRFVPVEWNNKPCMRVEVYGTAIGKLSAPLIFTAKKILCRDLSEGNICPPKT